MKPSKTPTSSGGEKCKHPKDTKHRKTICKHCEVGAVIDPLPERVVLTPQKARGEIDYYNFLVTNGLPKKKAEEAVEYVKTKLDQATQQTEQRVRRETVEEMGFAITDVLAEDYCNGIKATEIADKVEKRFESNKQGEELDK